MSEEGSVPEWAAELPEEMRDAPVIKNTPDIATAAKRLIDLDRYRGASLALPKDSDPESQKRFTEAVTKRGFIPGEIPGTPDAYPDPPEDVKEGLTDDWLTERKSHYHALGLTVQQAKKAIEADATGLVAKEKALREKYGESGIKAIEETMQKLGLDKGEESLFDYLLEQSKIMNQEDTTSVPGGAPVQSESLEDMEARLMEMGMKLMELDDYDRRKAPLQAEHDALVMKVGAAKTGDANLAKMTLQQAGYKLRRKTA